jgi:outer membrane biosynthesis protein TonB
MSSGSTRTRWWQRLLVAVVALAAFAGSFAIGRSLTDNEPSAPQPSGRQGGHGQGITVRSNLPLAARIPDLISPTPRERKPSPPASAPAQAPVTTPPAGETAPTLVDNPVPAAPAPAPPPEVAPPPETEPPVEPDPQPQPEPPSEEPQPQSAEAPVAFDDSG